MKALENRWIFAIIALLLVGGILYVASGSAPTVDAQGYSSLDATPDEVSVYLTIETRNLNAQTAQSSNEVIKGNVLSRLYAQGISSDAVKLGSFSVYPEYDWSNGSQVFKGFVARQDIIVETKEFSEVSGIVDAAIDGGALVSYINFELSTEKQNEYKAQALRAASEDAKRKAEATAAGLNRNLGSLVSVNSQEFNYYPTPYYARAEDSPSAASGAEAKRVASSIAPQDLDVSASVSVKYKLRRF